MTFKKVMSALLAGAMVLTMGMSAMASSDETSKSDLETLEIPVTSTVKVPTLKIMVPNSIGLVVNPYRLEANVGTEQDPIVMNGQVISKTYFIKNYSDLGVKVTPTLTGGAAFTVLPSGTPATSPNADGYLEKQGVINFEYMQANDGNEPTWAATPTKLVLNPEEEAKPSPSAIPVLNIGKDTAGAVNFDNSLAFRFTGQLTGTPTDPWTTEDTVEAALVFEFASQPNENAVIDAGDVTKAEIDLLNTPSPETSTITKPDDATKEKIAWYSSDPTKATVARDDSTGNGVVTPVANGKVTISAIYQDTNKKVHIDTTEITVVSKYKLAFTTTQTNGSYTVTDAAGNALSTGDKVAAGTLIKVTVTADSGKTCSGVAVAVAGSAPTVTDAGNGVYTFEMPAEEVTAITATIA